MTEIRRLTNPPISEGLFDIRVKARPDFDVSDFKQLIEILKERFPKTKEIRESKFFFPIPAGVENIKTEDGLQGIFFLTENEKLIAQFRVDGFTLNKIKPYSSFDELLPVALELWNYYDEIAQPEAITRIALRYINQIQFEYEWFEFDDFFRVAPQIPPVLPQTLEGFSTNFVMIDDKRGQRAKVVQEFKHNRDRTGSIYILDIDTSKPLLADFVIKTENLRELFSELKEFKNEIFFNFLTEKMLERFK